MKHAQLSHPLNWILVLFAGAFFLLLFISITRSILDTGEGVSEATTINVLTNIIQKTKANPETRITTTLPEITVDCENGVFQLTSGKQQRAFTTHALFAPEQLRGETTLWSEEFKLVNPITTLTYLFPRDTLYITTESVPNSLADSLSQLTYKTALASELSTLDLQGYPHIVIIAANADVLQGRQLTVEKGQEVHGIWFNTGTIKFYSYTGKFVPDGESTYVNKEFLLAAIAAVTNNQYACGLAVADTQTRFLASINLARTKILLQENPPEICRRAYEQAANAYASLANNGLENPRAAHLELQRASKTLGDNGCPNI